VEVADQKQKVVQAQMRIKLIEDELPTDFKSVLERTLKKNLALGPFTRNENGSCFFCRYKISKLDESEIDMQKQLKTCPQCSRIFLPYGI
jgi:predicted  nucleic acid-binding Zn-ribbon protein